MSEDKEKKFTIEEVMENGGTRLTMEIGAIINLEDPLRVLTALSASSALFIHISSGGDSESRKKNIKTFCYIFRDFLKQFEEADKQKKAEK